MHSLDKSRHCSRVCSAASERVRWVTHFPVWYCANPVIDPFFWRACDNNARGGQRKFWFRFCHRWLSTRSMTPPQMHFGLAFSPLYLGKSVSSWYASRSQAGYISQKKSETAADFVLVLEWSYQFGYNVWQHADFLGDAVSPLQCRPISLCNCLCNVMHAILLMFGSFEGSFVAINRALQQTVKLFSQLWMLRLWN
jgi:hypothetical protein